MILPWRPCSSVQDFSGSCPLGLHVKAVKYPIGRVLRTSASRADEPAVSQASRLTGFMCQVGLRTKRLIFRTEIREGGTRQVIYRRLGDPAHVKLDEARAQALEELARATRIGKPEALAGTTMADAWAAYRARLEKKQRSVRTIEDYEQKWNAHIEPTFGKRALRDITRADAMRLHERLTRKVGPYAANGTCRVAHAVYRHAALALEVPGLPALNPFRWYDLHNIG